MSAVLRYTVGRILVFAASLGVLYLIGFRRWALVLVAIVVSMPLAYVLLRRQRASFAVGLERVLSRRRAEKARLQAALESDDDEFSTADKVR
ncbi:hypothetical protein GCM10009765_01160 [Fodinicola feengrottensis]|uniref:DUF4229 domain-containing protein n=1 Tax=Fodinicola feengrottensis TaxID=435914 RepID=A0ABN2FPE9_9ACTN